MVTIAPVVDLPTGHLRLTFSDEHADRGAGRRAPDRRPGRAAAGMDDLPRRRQPLPAHPARGLGAAWAGCRRVRWQLLALTVSDPQGRPTDARLAW